MNTRARRFTLALAFLLPAATATAQREGYSYLSYVGSEVSLVSSAEDDSTARLNTPILAGDRIATGSSSRAEAILADGNVLRIDVLTNLRFDRLAKTYEADDARDAIYLERGAVSLESRYSTTVDQATRIDTDDATIVFPDKGLLRVETGRRGTEIYVASGRAEVFARSGRAVLRAGQYAFASGDAQVDVDWLEEPRDRFTRFVEERRGLSAGRPETQSVAADYAYDYAVADFDQYGSWVSVNGVSCWRPSVAAGWRPYADGYWRWSPAGLTWVPYEPWGWLPYHYGSWLWDAGFGWCWSPDAYYSPAWVYWSYTPSWVGWCPIGYYGGYYGGSYGGYDGGHYDGAHRSRRHQYGSERGTHAYPHLRGHVDVTRVDPRGWSYAAVSRLGTRFDSRRDVLSHERVGFRSGERGLVATTPLRIDRGRGKSATSAVQEAVRRVPVNAGAEPRGGRDAGDLTPVLRRDATLGTTAGEQLRRSFVTRGQDPGYRPVAAEQIASPRRETAGGMAETGVPSRGSERGLGASASPGRGTETSAPSRSLAGPARESWRDGGVGGEIRGGRGADTAPRSRAEAPLGGGFARERTVRGDDGWRSPGTDTRSGAPPSRTSDAPARRSIAVSENPEAPARTGRRETAPEPEPWRGATQPPTRRDAPPPSDGGSSPSARREVPAPRADEGWRGGDVPARGSRPVEAPPSPRSEPPSRTYEAPRPAPAPRSEAPPSRSYEAPPQRSYEAPRQAPAPRSEAPPSRSYSSPSSGSSAPPTSRSSDAPQRSAPPRG